MTYLRKKQTKSKGITYEYWYVEHHIGNKIKWCYLGKYEKIPEEYKKLINKDTQTDTQNISKSEKPKIVSKSQNTRAGSLARIGHEPPKLGVAGSNPVPPANLAVEDTFLRMSMYLPLASPRIFVRSSALIACFKAFSQN